MNDTIRNRRLDKAQLRVLFTVAFFAPGVARLPVIFTDDPDVDTACTDGERIYWSRQWFDSLPDDVLPTVLCHEVAHALLGHLWRIPTGGDWGVWNQAIDHAVNNMLKGFGEERKKQSFPDPFPMPDGNICCDPKYAAMSEEAIFADLMSQPSQNGSGRSGGRSTPQSGGKSAASGPGGSGRPGKSGQAPGRKPFGEVRAPRGTVEQVKQQQNGWKATLHQSVAMAKGQGNLPGEIMRAIDQMLHPEVPWVDLLRVWLREKADDDWNWMKPNVYFDGDFILPSLDSERMGKVVFATDTSGSINDELLSKFQAEKQSCLDDLKPAALIDLCCDAQITQEKEYRVGDRITRECPGGGGTRFEPVFKRLQELPEKPKMVVYLTDLMGTFPSEAPDYPVLWVVYNNADPKPPFGDVVVIK